MNRKEALQYTADSLLMDALFRAEFGLYKSAGLFDDLNLSSVGESLKNFVKSHVSKDHPGGYLGSVADLLAPTVLLRINPIFGVIYLVASQFGFDVTGTISKIFSVIKPKLESGQPVTSEEVSSIGKDIVASEAGPEVTAAPEDLFGPIRKYARGGMFDFNSYFGNLGGRGSSLPSTPWLSGGKGSTLEKIFGGLFKLPGGGKSKALWLIGGFVIWIVKTVLLGAGLLAGAEAVSKLLGHKSTTENKNESIELNKAIPSEQYSPAQSEDKPSASAPTKPDLPQFSQQTELWVVPIINNLEDTLAAWIQDLEPQISNQIIDKVKKTTKFKTIMTILKDPRRLGGKTLVMPPQFTSRQQVVDLLLKDFK